MSVEDQIIKLERSVDRLAAYADAHITASLELMAERDRLTAWRDGLKFCPFCMGMVEPQDASAHHGRCRSAEAERDRLRDRVAALEAENALLKSAEQHRLDATLRAYGLRGGRDEDERGAVTVRADSSASARKLADEWDMRERP